MAVAFAVVSEGVPAEEIRAWVRSQAGSCVMKHVGILAALSAWRLTQGIYLFDADVAAAVVSTPLDGPLPAEALYALPEWCVYVPLPPNLHAHGFWAHLEHDANTGRPELRFVVDAPSGLLQPLGLHLTRRTLGECLESFFEESHRQAQHHGIERWEQIEPGARRTWPEDPDEIRPSIEAMTNMVLYICTQNADVRAGDGSDRAPRRPRPVKTRGAMREFPAPRATPWEVGFRVGAALRAARGDAEGSRSEKAGRQSPAPHIRRAHWHSFWSGSKTGKGGRRITVKWLPPIPVNTDAGQIVPTVRPVR